MPRVRTRFPTVFVGHPFGIRFPTKKFRKIFLELPFKVVYGNTDMQTEHLLDIMKNHIRKSDFSIFDLSNWNPNVSMELGLSEGLKRKPGKQYYILLNTRRSHEVPADVRGIQRLEYTSYDYKPQVGLGDQLIQYVMHKEYWVKKILKEIGGGKHASKKLRLCLKIVAHLRDNQKLTPDNLGSLVRGTRLRKGDRQEVLQVLRKLKLVRRLRNSSAYARYRTVFRGLVSGKDHH